MEEEISLATILCREGEIISQRVRDAFGLQPLDLGGGQTVSL
jgi:hypothetical protein